MESIHELIDSLRHRQIRLWLEEDRLRFSAPEGAMSGELLARLRAHKPALMSMLAQTAGDAIPRVDRGGPLPLSPAQERLWMVGRLAGAGDPRTTTPSAGRTRPGGRGEGPMRSPGRAGRAALVGATMALLCGSAPAAHAVEPPDRFLYIGLFGGVHLSLSDWDINGPDVVPRDGATAAGDLGIRLGG
ncbi:MAG: hypothetical protein KC621_15580, partial [Myxococcales bacterium]|nr:hypothetical protein [Myxococcales bacterium]